MLIKRIRAKKYKTYLNLDLDITVEPERPIILIGGENGGGKTSLFEAIYGALYGLRINTEQDFRELLNAGISNVENEKIELELHFSGMVLNEEKQYILSRTYLLNSERKPVEGVKFNMSGSIITYGTATAAKERADNEAQVNKIIKANLPQELSRYFLFDAMEAGNLLKKDQLRRVIKENIENVMGFNKYITLSKASELVYEDYTAQRIEKENTRNEYLKHTLHRKETETDIEQLNEKYQNSIEFSMKNRQFYEDAKRGQSNEIVLKTKIERLKEEIKSIKEREENFRKEADLFAKNLEQTICLPKISDVFKSEISLIFKEQNAREFSNKNHFTAEFINNLTENLLLFLSQKGVDKSRITSEDLTRFFETFADDGEKYIYDFLEKDEIQSLSNLINSAYSNPYPAMYRQKNELTVAVKNIEKKELEIKGYEKQITGEKFEFIQNYEENEARMKNIQAELEQKKRDLKKIEELIASFDIQNEDEPDPKYETLKRLKPFFEELANQLLSNKKKSIELKMKADLNDNLAAYRNVIDRVELSENLKDLNFKIYHTAGNEIYLNQLNTASKQVVIQVLLKSLHEFGDYNPPVMIDTVMGVLDEQSRETVLENYFPKLSHQTILLSTDTEIVIGKDFEKIEPFVSKVYTLVRDKKLQKTEIKNDYFGKLLEN